MEHQRRNEPMRQPYQRNFKRITLSFTLCLLHSLLHPLAASVSPEQASQTLKLSENKRIEASICGTSMNRIAVSNDRITQLFGDEGTFESQNDETTGQIFLKPTLENGPKNLSLTLITEQGITQDLTLTPDAQSAKTLILTRDPADQGTSPKNMDGQVPYQEPLKQRDPYSHLGLAHTPLSQEGPRLGQVLTLLKQAMNGHLSAGEEEFLTADRPSPQGFALACSKMWKAGPYVVHAIKVENLTDDSLPLQEKDFYQPGDLALSFDNREAHLPVAQPTVLEPHKEVTLYVARPDTRAEDMRILDTSVFGEADPS